MNSVRSTAPSLDISGIDRSTLIAFILMVIFAGGNPVAVRFSNSGLPPFWGAAIRFGAAALIFWVIVLAGRISLPKGRALSGALLYGFLSIGAAYAFLYWGLQRAPAGLAGAILAFAPLMTIFFAWIHGLEKLRWQGVLGALIATVGILIGIFGGFGGEVHIPSVLALLAGVACVSEATVVYKLIPKSPPMATNAVALTTGAPVLLGMSLLFSEPWALPATLDTWIAYAYLVVIGSVVMFYLYLHVLSKWTASATSYAFLLIPVSTVILAALIAGEQITISFIIGTILVLFGVWIGAIRKSPEAAEINCAEMPNKAIC